MNRIIERLTEKDIDEFHDLVKRVYDEFVSGDYSEKGNQTFYSYIQKNEIQKRINEGQWAYTYKINGEIVGVLEIRNKNHISLFFVDKQNHGQKIGRKLFDHYLGELKKEETLYDFIEVNSSPFAKGIYEKLGFNCCTDLEERDGIKFYYMKRELDY